MKILIVEDSQLKENGLLALLKKYSLNDVAVERCLKDAIKRASTEKFELLITDLGLPIFLGERVTNAKEGLSLLNALDFEEIRIPTLIYSSTKITNQDTAYLDFIEWPLYGQAENEERLDDCLIKILNGTLKYKTEFGNISMGDVCNADATQNKKLNIKRR